MASKALEAAMATARSACVFLVDGAVGRVCFDFPDGASVRFLPTPYDTVIGVEVEDARRMVEERLDPAIETTGPLDRRAANTTRLFTKAG